MIQTPARILEWAVQYKDASDHRDIISLVIGIVVQLPLIINPLGVILLRRGVGVKGSSSRAGSVKVVGSRTEMDSGLMQDRHASDV